jgi:hypothetical protein
MLGGPRKRTEAIFGWSSQRSQQKATTDMTKPYRQQCPEVARSEKVFAAMMLLTVEVLRGAEVWSGS